MKDSNNRKRKKNRPLDNNVFIEAANDSSDYWEYANKVMPRILATKSGNDIYGNSVRKTVQEKAEVLCGLKWEVLGDNPSASQKYLAAIEHTLGRPAYNELKEIVSNPQLRNISDREQLIVLCFAMVELGATVMDCDEIIISASSEKIHHRPLYQLDAREGYFRFILYWNEKHRDAQITYRSVCDELYPKFQIELIQGVKDGLDALEKLMVEKNVGEEIFERLKAVNHQPINEENLAGIRATLTAIKKKIDHGETDVTRNISIETTAMQHDTVAQQQEVAQFITECGDDFDKANGWYTELAIQFIGEKDWTAASIIIQALSDVSRMQENWKLYGISNYQNELQEGMIKAHENNQGSRLSRALITENIIISENNPIIARMIYPRSRLADIKEDIDSDLFVDCDDSPLPESMIAGEPNKELIKTLVQSSGLYNKDYSSNMTNGVVSTSRRDLLRFAFAVGCQTIDEFCSILSLSGDKSLRRNNKCELLTMMLLQYISSKESDTNQFSILKAIRYTEQIYILFSVKEYIQNGTEILFEEKSIKKLIKEIKNGLIFPQPDVLSQKSDAFLNLTISVYAVIESLVSMINEEDLAKEIEAMLLIFSVRNSESKKFAKFLYSDTDYIEETVEKSTWNKAGLAQFESCFRQMANNYIDYLKAYCSVDGKRRITLELIAMHDCIVEICWLIEDYLFPKIDSDSLQIIEKVLCQKIHGAMTIFYDTINSAKRGAIHEES